MSRESRREKYEEQAERGQSLHEILKEVNRNLRAKVIKKELEALGIQTEFDIQNNTGYTLNIEIVDNLIIINKVEKPKKKKAKQSQRKGLNNVRTDRQRLATYSCDCRELCERCGR